MPVRIRCLCLLTALIATLAGSANAQEAQLGEAVAPASVAETPDPLSASLEPKVWGFPIYHALKRKLEKLPPFFRDTHLAVDVRSYYFWQDGFGDSKSEALALGGSLAYESGWLADTLQIGAELFTSQRLYGPRDRDGTRLLRSGQKGYTVLGQSYATLRYGEHQAWIYRRIYQLPYLNAQDNRMSPNTFEGYSLAGRIPFGTSGLELAYVSGHILRMKERNAQHFRSMSHVAGVAGDRDRGTTIGGIRLNFGEAASVGVIDLATWDVFNTLYVEGTAGWSLTDELALRIGAQLTDQRSIGDDLLTGPGFDTQSFGARIAASHSGATLQLAYTTTSRGGAIMSPFGSKPSYISLMIDDFDQPGADSVLVGLAFNFHRLGLEELTAATLFARSFGVAGSLHDRNELDVTLDYKPTAGALRGFWLRLRAAHAAEPGTGRRANQIRVVLRYDLPVL